MTVGGPAGPLPALEDLCADRSHFEMRFVRDLDRLDALCQVVRRAGLPVVLTSGSFDILHEGHSLYLEAARDLGGFLVVGVDSDEKVADRKGLDRPVVPQRERVRMLTHQRGVGLVFLKELHHPRWELIRRVRPDVLVVTEGAHSQADVMELERLADVVKVMPRMAEVSTTGRMRTVQLAAGGRA